MQCVRCGSDTSSLKITDASLRGKPETRYIVGVITAECVDCLVEKPLVDLTSIPGYKLQDDREVIFRGNAPVV